MRVVIAEDSMLFREGLAMLLEDRGHEVVASVGDADALRIAVAEHTPDLAIIDIRMPPDMQSAGAVAALDLRRDHPALGLLLLSQHVELRHCRPLIGTPGFGYLLKDRVLDLDDFAEAIERVVAGGTALDPEVVRSLVDVSPATALDTLTARERDVLRLVAQGLTNTVIGTLLHLSDRTVETHLRTVFTKLGLTDDGSTHRRILAVIAWLDAAGAEGSRDRSRDRSDKAGAASRPQAAEPASRA
jgi:DNA-binding NarL/FixJ family response regulator